MTKVNILFADEVEDVDIIVVPENIANNIKDVAQKFFNWVFEGDNKNQFEKKSDSGRIYVSIATRDFIWWLNNYEIHSAPYASIVEEHTALCSDYPTVEF
jgi:hypothetical protein